MICECTHPAFVHRSGVCAAADVRREADNAHVTCDCIEFTDVTVVRPANWLEPITLPVSKV